MRNTLPLPLALLVLVAACGDGPVVPPEVLETPGLTVSGAGVTDTIDAILAQALRVRVVGQDGRPAAGTIVRVDPPPIPYVPGGIHYEVLAATLDGGGFGIEGVDSTDDDGVVFFRIQMGRRAGPGRLVVTVPTLGMRDTARFTILPGAPASVAALPADTVISIGGQATVRAGVHDRRGNPRPEAVQLTASGVGGTLAGTVLSGTEFGLTTVVASSGELSDTSYVSVVPRARIAAYAMNAPTLLTFELDGTGLTPILTTEMATGRFSDLAAAWISPTKLAYHDRREGRIFVHDLLAGVHTRLLPDDGLALERTPRVGPGRDWVYFVGVQNETPGIYRARPDGSQLERISGANVVATERSPSPSPDGTEIAYISDRGGWGEVRVRNLATRQARSLGVTATSARWSPDGSSIVYVVPGGGSLRLVSPDGSSSRQLSSTGYLADIDWSPDGRYVVGVVGSGRIGVVEVATGRELILSYSGSVRTFLAPTWAP